MQGKSYHFVLFLSLLTLTNISCRKSSSKYLENYVIEGVTGVIEVSLFRMAKYLDKNEFLSMPIVRDRMEYTRFGDLYTSLLENPEDSGIKLLEPMWIVSGVSEGQPINYLLIQKQKNLKFEQFLKQLQYQEYRALEGFKVLVKGPYGIAFDRDLIILGKAEQIPIVIDALKKNQEHGSRPKLLEHLNDLPGKQIIRFAFDADFPDFLEEQKDRLFSCGLDWKEKDRQFISGFFKTQGMQISLNLKIHFEESWKRFYDSFFHAGEQNGPLPNVPQGVGSVYRSRFNMELIREIAASECPIDVMDRYISLPSKSLILEIMDHMDGRYGIMIPDYEFFLENHVFFLYLKDSTNIQTLLGEKAYPVNEQIFTLQNPKLSDPKDLIYYMLDDNMLLISRNALNLVKLSETEAWQDWLATDDSSAFVHINQQHLQALLGTDDAKEAYFKELDIQINPGNLQLQINMDSEGPGAWASILQFINYLYTNNKQFYDWWDTEDTMESIEL